MPRKQKRNDTGTLPAIGPFTIPGTGKKKANQRRGPKDRRVLNITGGSFFRRAINNTRRRNGRRKGDVSFVFNPWTDPGRPGCEPNTRRSAGCGSGSCSF